MKYGAEHEIFVDIAPVPKEYATSLKSHGCVEQIVFAHGGGGDNRATGTFALLAMMWIISP
jgi:hypothetical protein